MNHLGACTQPTCMPICPMAACSAHCESYLIPHTYPIPHTQNVVPATSSASACSILLLLLLLPLAVAGVVAVALEPAEQGDMVPIPIALAIPSLDLSLVSPTEATGT